MSTLRLTVLSSLSKPNSGKEHLDSHSRQWFTDGYRTSVPGTNTCRQDTDCELGEICQGGYCAGLHQKYDLQGIYRGSEYKSLVQDQHFPLEDVSIYVLGHGFTYSQAPPQTVLNQPADDGDFGRQTSEKHRRKHGFNYNYNYDYA